MRDTLSPRALLPACIMRSRLCKTKVSVESLHLLRSVPDPTFNFVSRVRGQRMLL
ncbi:hypothetical protein PAHAL_8G126200 [Panicum hallii]|uniref:Uncharacterized protein n=1 Tax=Panicum hallii TaxID=206008 RepID=A0A2S3IDL3_9POAL|nr:hypothetical protein PAHAL_8G126200 [Panicum hallii]